MKKNMEVRFMFKRNRIYAYEIAEKLNIHENTLFRMLRKPLTEKQRLIIYNAVSEILKERESEVGL